MPLPANLSVIGPSARLVQPIVPVPVAGPGGIAGGATAPTTLARLKAIRALLVSMGITDLSRLGTFAPSSGNHLVQPGLVLPTIVRPLGPGGAVVGPGPILPAVPSPEPVPFTGAAHLTPTSDGNLLVRPLSGTARPLAAAMLPQFRQQSPSLSIYDAVWVATTITLADNVHFTWTRPPIPPLNMNFAPGNAPHTPPQVPATTTPGQPGAVGTAGSPGANGDSGNSGDRRTHRRDVDPQPDGFSPC